MKGHQYFGRREVEEKHIVGKKVVEVEVKTCH